MRYFDQYPAVTTGEKDTKLGEEPHIHPSCRIKDSKIGGWTALGANTFLVESSFGDYSYTAGNVQIIYSEIGKYCSIANSVRINPGNHPQWRVTQHHMTYRRKHYGLGAEDDKDFFQWRRDHRCVIGHDVWIGHGAVIMPGVQIGTGAVIGSGAVVTKNIGPYEVAVGVAAKVIKKRFDEATIGKLLASEWWNWDRATLEERFEDLLDLEKFLASPALEKPGVLRDIDIAAV
ncbi:MAG: DapH/DapD/GlmU-related protein [Puia sp.]|nr:DapH/DapD/GlmU-related protein [Puia sp.]